jgi:hypothetical protein
MSDALYLYCVLPPGQAPPPGLRGIDDAPVEAVVESGLTLWTSSLSRRPAASIEAIQHHNAVVEAALKVGVTPVPLRFGQFVRVRELPARVADHRDAWRSALASFAGCAEYGVRVIEPDREPPARDVHRRPESGRAYLEAVARSAGLDRERQARAEELAAMLRARLGDAIARDRVEPLPSAHGLASIAHLVPLEKVDEYRKRIDAARAELPALRFLTSGPWPPYSFAE